MSKSADLNKYEYASISDAVNYDGRASLMDLDMRVYETLESAGFTMVGNNIINELTDEQKEKLLLVKFSATSRLSESVIIINFLDYLTGKPVATCRGAYGDGLSRQGDMNGAIKKVVKQVRKLWKNKK